MASMVYLLFRVKLNAVLMIFKFKMSVPYIFICVKNYYRYK